MKAALLLLALASFSFSQARPAWLPPSAQEQPAERRPARQAKPLRSSEPRLDSMQSALKALSGKLQSLSDSLDSAARIPPALPDTVQRRWHVVWTVANADTMRAFGVSNIFEYPRRYGDLLGIVSDTKQAGHSVYEFAATLSNHDTLRYSMGGTSSRSTGNVISQTGNYEGKIEYYNTGLTMSIYPDGKSDIEYISTDLAQTTLRIAARKTGSCVNAYTQFLSTETTRILWILWAVHRQQVKHLWLAACYEDLEND